MITTTIRKYHYNKDRRGGIKTMITTTIRKYLSLCAY